MGPGRVVLYVGDGLAHAVSSLRDRGEWTVERVATAAAADDRLAEVDCVVCEGTDPDGPWRDVWAAADERVPALPVVLLAPGDGSADLARTAVEAGVTEYAPESTLAGPGDLPAVVADALSAAGDTDRRYSRLVEHTSDLACVLDADGVIEYVDPTVESLLGYDQDESLGVSVFERIHPADRNRARTTFERAKAEPAETFTVEYRVEAAEGDWRWMSTRIRSYLDDPAIEGVITNGRDISERKERDRERELYETMVNAVPDGVYAIDDDGVFLALNDTAEEMCDRDAEEMVGKHVSEVMREADIEQGRQLIEELLADDSRGKAIYEMELRAADGETIPVENHIALLRDDTGEPDEGDTFRGSVGVFRDIRDRVQREHRLAVLNRALRHDLRNSMHVIMANAELVEETVADPATAEKLRTIQRRAEQINSLGEKAREIEAILGTENRACRSVDLVPVLTELLERFGEEYPGATIEADLPGTARVRASELVDVAVENLLENSLEHTDDPTVEVTVTVDPETVRLTVGDDGPGIPEKERRVVTQGSETPLDHASGLGLWLVAWITRDSGGEVVFEDEGDGSAVRLELDRADADAVGGETGERAGGEHAE